MSEAVFRAVLEGAGYKHLDLLGCSSVADGKRLGELAQQQTLEIIARRDALEAELAEAVGLLKVSTALLECNAQPIDKPSIEANTAFLARHGDQP